MKATKKVACSNEESLRRVIAVCLLVGATSPVSAQVAAPPNPDLTPPTPAAAPSGAAQPAAIADANTPPASEIVVTGVRASIQRAQDIKRNAVTVVEAISSEDLGKFSDQSIGDALARVPGLQIQRNDDVNSGDRISIRGLGPDFVSVTLNGREALSYGDTGNRNTPGRNQRNFNFDAIPSEVLINVLVYKSSQAEQVEPGIAGQVDLRTLHPLDQRTHGKSYFGGLTVQGSYDDIATKWSPRVSGYVGTKLLDDTLGVYFAGVWADTKLRQDALEINYVSRTVRTIDDQGNVTSIPNILAPAASQFRARTNERKRLVLTGAIQYKPSSHLDVNLDLTYNRYDVNQDNPILAFSPDTVGTVNGELPNGAYQIKNGGLVYVDTSKAVYRLAGDVFNSTSNYIAPQNELDPRKIRQYNGGANILWHNDQGFSIKADYGYSEVDLNEHYFNGITFAPPTTLAYDATNPTAPKVIFQQNIFEQIFDPAVYKPAYDFTNSFQDRSRRNSYRLDLEKDISVGDFHVKLKVGSRYAKTTVDFRSGGFFDLFGQPYNYPTITYPNGTPVPGGAYTPGRVAGLSNALNAGNFSTPFQGQNFGGYNGSLRFPVPSFVQACVYLATDYCGLTGPRSAFGQASFTGPFPTSTNPQEAAPINSVATYLINEENLAAYGQADFSGRLLHVPIDGSVGLRAVQITEHTQGFNGTRFRNDRVFNIQTAPDQLTSVADRNQYTQYLPSLSFNAHPDNNSTVRFNVAKTLTLPDYQELSPTGTVTKYFGGPAYDPTRLNDAVSGNTRLQPITAWNYDLTGEYYTRNKGSIVFSAFYKDVSNYILTTTVPTTVAGQGAELFNATTPLNISSGTAKGFEFGFNQPLTFLPSPFDGFGVQGAYTYVDSKLDTKGALGTTSSISFPGASKHNVNAIGYYEKHGFSFRIAFNYRTEYFVGTADGQPGQSVFTRPETRIDLSSSYAIFHNLEIIGSVTNVTGQGRIDYVNNPSIFKAEYNRPRTYTIGLRGSF